MRRNQISIHVERFGDQAPEGAKKQSVSVYADANNIFEALAAAYYRLMEEIQKDQTVPSFGRIEGRSKNFVYSSSPNPMARSLSPEERETRRQAWAEEYPELMGEGHKPTFVSKFLSWGVCSRGKVEIGSPLYVGIKWAEAFSEEPFRYHYSGYQDKNYKYKAAALDLNDVIDSLFYAPEKFSIEDYLEDYSSQEISLIRKLKEKLMEP